MRDPKANELGGLATEAQQHFEALAVIRGISDEITSIRSDLADLEAEADRLAGWKLFDDHLLDKLDDIADGLWWLERRYRPYLAGVQWRNDQARELFEGSPKT